MTQEKIYELIKKGENSFIEFKRCGNGIENDVYETVCAFSNRFGGYILCGVLDDGTINGLPEKATKSMLLNFANVISNPQLFSPTLAIEPEVVEIENKQIICIYVPQSAEVHSYKKNIYDRIGETDVKITSTPKIAEFYIRKQNIYTEQKVFKYATINELRTDLIEQARKYATLKNKEHPWKNLSDMELLQSAKLYTEDYQTGDKGINLAGILLLGKDDVIGSVCPSYKTDALVRKINTDRYDDREIVETNLIQSFDILMNFARKHLPDKFYLDGIQSVSIRDNLVREIISNILIHREYTSPYVSKFVIEKEKMYTENPCRAMNHIELKPETFTPVSKNPIIAKFFMNIGFADELGSGTRNIFKYTKLYSGKTPKMIEDDIFRTEIPLDENFSSDFGAVKAENSNISETQKQILALIKEDSKITASKIAEKLNFSSRAIEQNLKELRDKKIIERLGAKKNGVWKVL